MRSSDIGRAVGVALALAGSGCALVHHPAPAAAASEAAQAADLKPANTTPPERQHYIIELLGAGKRDQARVEVQQLLKEQPSNAEAATFLSEIDTDPQTLLGAQSSPHTIAPGETLTTLADKYLGDSNLFYALARYNNIDVPNSAAPGQAILIPSPPAKAKPAEHADRPEHEEHKEHSEHVEHTERAEHKEAAPALRQREETPPEAKKAAAPTAPAHDAARASSLRSQALVEMNKGAIDHAVTLLKEASGLDPDSQPIAADLARALRIQGGAHK